MKIKKNIIVFGILYLAMLLDNTVNAAYQSPSLYITQSEKQIRKSLSDPRLTEKDRISCQLLLARKLAVQQQLNKSQKILFGLSKKRIAALNLEGDYELCYAILLKYASKQIYSLESYKEALRLFKKSNQKLKVLDAYIELMEYYRKFPQYDKGLAISKKIEKLLLDIPNVPNYYKVRWLNRKAAILSEMGKRVESRKISRYCISLAEKNKDWYLAAVSHNELGFAYYGHGHDSCIHHLLIAQKLFRKTGAISDAIDIELNLYNLNDFYLKRNPSESYQNTVRILKEIDSCKIQYPQLIRLYEQASAQLIVMKKFELVVEYKERKYNEYVRASSENAIVEAAIIKNNKQLTNYKNENKRIKYEKLEREERLVLYFSLALIFALAAVFIYFLYQERKRFAKKLQLENDIQKGLIKEIHHRVKNNLHFISSLIQMQERSIKNVELKEPLNDLFVRIQSMSAVHELLYSKDKTDFVMLNEYMLTLIKTLENTKKYTIQYSLSAELHHEKIDSRSSMSIGIIVAELYTNSVKHSFTKTKDPIFSINIERRGEYLCFQIKDNGPGFDDPHGKGLGMRLIDIFSRQLKASYSISGDSGLDFTLNLKNGEF